MKTLVLIFTAVSIGLFGSALVFLILDYPDYQEKAMGYGTLILFFLLIPSFLIWRYQVKQEKASRSNDANKD